MKYCVNCGAQLNDDDLFCGACGAKQPESSKMGNAVGKIQNLNLDFKGVVKSLGNVFLKPVSASEEFVQRTSRNNSILATVILLLISAILGMWRIQQVLSGIEKLLTGVLGSSLIGNIIGSTSRYFDAKQDLHIPYGMIFIENAFVFILAVAVIFGVLYLALNVVDKNKVNILTIYNIAVIYTVPFLYFKLISIIVSYVSNSVGIFVELIGLIISIVTLVLIIRDIFKVDKDKAVIITVVVSIIVIFIAMFCLNSFVQANIKQIMQSQIDGAKLNI
ncbi:metal-binding protein [Clostridium acetobutylicum]|nr:metal-binding protein [Clostridium acetobutylicum]